ncbi:uncharacterized protein Tco025E_04420 [Trypanosoma conorhini]|uniref:Uncharacterized protein n=1 Tax=Trypanosoma conorhini TaxID=83891 RepID=A0A422PLN1_9TRYP|nr:uncharacterized protein Tco025E_04420 [Trypanosoma conorhini]RNF18622.1 hypothetical protein Tco025E_04420 [Trypanosoma conorhini]
MQHMLLGNVLRETDTHLLVRFDIPCHCLPPGVWSSRAGTSPEAGRGEERDVGDKNSGQSHDDDEVDGVKLKGGDERVVDAAGDAGACGMNFSSPHDEPEAGGGSGSGGGSSLSRPIRFVVGIVPVLVLTHDNAAVPTPRRKVQEAQATDEESEKLRSSCTTTLSTVHFSNETAPDVLHVSLSVTRSGCTSLLQSLLEQHEKLECVSSAVANRDFKSAARHILAVIDARRSLVAGQKEFLKGVNDSQRAFPVGLRSNPPPPGSEAGRRSDDIVLAERRRRFVMVFRRDRGNSSCLEFHPLLLSTRNDEENLQAGSGGGGGSDGGKGGGSLCLPPTDIVEVHSVGCHELPTLQVMWHRGRALKELASLYALLSFLRFQDGQYEQCLEDAVTALAHDCTCIEAYTRLMSGFIALGGEQEAIVAAAVAVRCCLVLSPQFARVSRLAYVCAFYHRNLGKHSVVDVSPRLRHASLAEVGSFRESAGPSKTQRLTRRPTLVRMRGLGNSFTAPAPFSFVPPPSLRNILSGASPPMEYFLRNLRARALCGFEPNETVFSEVVSLQVLLWGLPTCEPETSAAPCAEVEAGLASPWLQCRSRFCAYCGHPLVSRNVLLAGVRERTSQAMADRVRWKFTEKKPLPCLEGCGDHYCNEICRNRAALEYHWIECAMLPADAAAAAAAAAAEKEKEGEEDAVEPPSPHARGTAGDATETRDVGAAVLSPGGEDPQGPLLELLPYAPSPLKRRGVRGLVNVCRRLHTQKHRLDAVGVSLGVHGPTLRQDGSTSSSAEAMIERDRTYMSTVQACRSVLPAIRAAFSDYYATVGNAMLGKAPNATTAALLVLGRLLASVLRLFMPEAAASNEIAARGKGCFIGTESSCRERATAVRTIVARYASRGFTSGGGSPSDQHDCHGLCLAEEVLQQLRVPFFADTNLLQPSTVWEILGEAPKVANASKKDEAPSAAAAAMQSMRRGFDHAVEFLRALDAIVQSRLRDEAVAFSLSMSPERFPSFALQDASVSCGDGEGRVWTKSHSEDPRTESSGSGQGSARRPPFLMDVGTLAVWLSEEHSKVTLPAGQYPAVWSFGRLLGFLGKRRFMEQIWDFCVSSYCVVPRCVLSAGIDDGVPEHLQEGWRTICRQYTVLVAVMGPLTSLVTDLAAFGDEACSRFFKDAAPGGQRNPLHLRRGDSPAASMLSINSLTHEPDELHTRATTHSMGAGSDQRPSPHGEALPSAALPLGNLELCGNNAFNSLGGRCVTMRAKRLILPGEELRYEGKCVLSEDTNREMYVK